MNSIKLSGGKSVVLILVFCVLTFVITIDSHAATKRIAVLNFENNANSVLSENEKLLRLLMNKKGIDESKEREIIGRSVTDSFMVEIVKNPMFTVVERNQLESILNEQKISSSGLINKSDAAKIGKLLGVSAIIMGTINQYSLEKHKKGILGVGVNTVLAKVAVNVRIVDASTGEILFASEGKGEEENANVSVGSLYQGNSNAGETLMREATKKALAVISSTIKANASKFQDNVINGRIVYSSDTDKTFLINVGSNKGILKDQVLCVKKVVKEIIDPDSKEVLKTITENIAEIKITSIDQKTSTAICTKGSCDDIKERDIVSSN
jgi:curli biogenesis system outer membrane secretion channel CsgG